MLKLKVDMSVKTEAELPKVTIVTATYNRADLLPETIDSILAQDYPNIEYLVLDDGSVDSTADIIKPYLEKYPHIIKYDKHPNMGEARTVNKGWDMATGDYLMVVSSDDPQPNPNLVKEMVAALAANPDAVVSFPDWNVIDEASQPVFTYKLGAWDIEYMVRNVHCFIGPGALINRKKLFGKIPFLRSADYKYVSDYDCWLRIGLLGDFVHVPKVLAAWRRHEGATTLQNIGIRIASEQKRLFDTFFENPDLPANIGAHEKRVRAYLFMVVAKHSFRDNPWQFCKYAWSAFMISPREFIKRNLDTARAAARKIHRLTKKDTVQP